MNFIEKNTKIILACLIAGFFASHIKAQNQRVADSLIVIVHDNQYSDSALCFLYNKIAFNSTHPNDLETYALKASKIAKRIKDYRQLALSFRYTGIANQEKGDLTKAIKYYLKAAENYQYVNLELGVAVVYIDLAGVYKKQGNTKNSKNYYLNAIRLLRHQKDSVRLASALLNYGELHRIMDNSDSAMYCLNEAELIFRKVDYPSRVAYALGNKGLIFAANGDYINAKKNFKEAILVLNELKDFDPIAVYQISLADIYSKQGDLKEALNYAHSALKIGKEEGLKEQIRDASLKLSELYQTQGDYRKAYDYQSQYITYRDSINNEEVIRKMADLRTEYEVSQKQAEVDLKQAEVDLLNEEARSHQIFLWGVIVILVLVLCLTYALLKVYRIKDRAVRIVKQRRRIIAAQRDQLQDVNRTKDKFFSIISHDIRGPISNFHGVSQLIQLLVESKDYEGLLKLGAMLDTSTNEVSSLLDNLLEWAMSQQGRMPYKQEEVQLHELCNSNLSIMQNLATAKKIKLNNKVKEEISITADKNSVSTIIRNLVNNAIKFTPEGGKVKLKLANEQGWAIISVKDSGIGIPKEKMEHLFDFQGERRSWGTSGEKGVGLGLSLVQEFTELNKGKIEVESEENKGTTFRIYLPIESK